MTRSIGLVLIAAVALALTPALSAAQASGKKGKKTQPEFVWLPHPSLRVGKDLRVDFRARFAAEHSQSDTLTTDQPQLDRARRRVGIDGEVMRAVGFQVEVELANDDPWRDVFANYQQFAFAQAQFGKFKLPFSVDENTGSTNLDFAYRSLAASTLSPGRDRGWMLHGHHFKHAIAFEYGQFDHDGKNATTSGTRVTGGTTTAYRVSSEPLRYLKLKHDADDLRIGYAATDSDLVEGFSSIRGKTVLGQTFYRSNYLVNGKRKRTGYELRWRPGPASLKWESMRLTEERLGESVEDSNLSPLVAKGWYVSGTVAVTGDSKSKGLDDPRRPLLPKIGPGAIEVAVRVERITFTSEAAEANPSEPGSTSIRADVVLGNSDRVVTFGLNWYPNHWGKLQFNLVKEELTDPAQGPAPGQPSFWSKVIRFQIGL